VVGQYSVEFEAAIAAAIEAGEAVRDLYERMAASTYIKTDGSPVTDADLAADAIICRVIAASFPRDAFLTEEGADDASRLAESRIWIVDPIDGTQQFVDRTGEFDVLIALIVDGAPTVAVMLQPTTGRYLAAEAGQGAWRGDRERRERVSFSPADPNSPPRLLTSVWLNMPAAEAGLERAATALGSAKPEISPLGMVVRHFLPPDNRFNSMIGLPTRADQTMAWEWDFAAADLVVHEAGGAYTDAWGRRFRYNKPSARNEGGVVLSVDPVTHERVLAALRPELPC
jgi:3'-phosphoadenosine 5'-phosphosulfate (PAPS) 3'-phosphatase